MEVKDSVKKQVQRHYTLEEIGVGIAIVLGLFLLTQIIAALAALLFDSCAGMMPVPNV